MRNELKNCAQFFNNKRAQALFFLPYKWIIYVLYNKKDMCENFFSIIYLYFLFVKIYFCMGYIKKAIIKRIVIVFEFYVDKKFNIPIEKSFKLVQNKIT